MKEKNMTRMVFACITLILICANMRAPGAEAPVLHSDWGRMPLYFVENRGQIDERVFFYAKGQDKTLYFTREGITFSLLNGETTISAGTDHDNNSEYGDNMNRWTVKLDFVNGNLVTPLGRQMTDMIVSEFKGMSDEWHTGLAAYSEIVFPDLWDGVDLVCRGTSNYLKYEFRIHPGADPDQIKMLYRGATIRVDDFGRLYVCTPSGSFQDDAPVAYQEIAGACIPVDVGYSLNGNSYGFHIGQYKGNIPLIIDPGVLVYCGYVGGSGWEDGESITVDTEGCAYIVGDTPSNQNTFPETVGPDLTHNGGDDVFIAKIQAEGGGLVYCGYIGGAGNEYSCGVEVDQAGNAYICGETNSNQTTFPVTVGPDLTHNGGYDAFVAKINPAGTDLIYCGYIGGTANDYAHGIDVDEWNQVYLTGSAVSTEATFPVTVGPDLTYNGGAYDAFVAKIHADGGGLDYCGYIGGDAWDETWGIAVDETGCVYVVGETDSEEATFPEGVGPDLTFNGGDDAFIAKVSADGSGLEYCGYIGGSDDEYCWGIGVDTDGNAYISGETASSQLTFPVTAGPDLTHNGGWDAFVAKVNAAGTGLEYCGYIGGDDADFGHHLALGAEREVYVVGGTHSTENTFPVTVGPDQTHNGGYDAFVAKVMADGSGLIYCSYLGGSGWEEAWDIAIDAMCNAYIIGLTGSSESSFPVAVGPDISYNGGSTDAFVAKLSLRCISHAWDIP